MSSELKEENIPKQGRGRPRTVNITDMKAYKKEYNREYCKTYKREYNKEYHREYAKKKSGPPKIKVTKNTLLEDIQPQSIENKNYNAKRYHTFYIFVKKLLEKDSIQINTDYKDKFLGFFTQSNCVK
jgi:hypothetical protein